METTTRELSLNREDLGASTLVGLNRENPQLDPLAVLHLDIRLYVTCEWDQACFLVKFELFLKNLF